MEIDPATLRAALWVLSAAASLLSATVGAILAYHWFTYSMNAVVSLIATVVYASVCATLLMVLFALTLSL